MPGYVKKAGTWELLKRPHGKTGGTWKQIAKAYTKRGGIWERWYSSAPPVEPTPTAITTFRVHVADGNEDVTFGWTENPASENVIDYEMVCVPWFGGVWLGDDPFMSDTPPAFAADGGWVQKFTIPAVTPGATILSNPYRMTNNGTRKSFRVRARNSFGYGPWSDIIHFNSNSSMTGSWTYVPAPDVQLVSFTINNPGLQSMTVSTTLSGCSGVTAPTAGASMRVGFSIPGGNGAAGTDGLNGPIISQSLNSPFTDQITGITSNFSTYRYRGTAICPSFSVQNRNYSTCEYTVVLTTQGFVELPVFASDIIEYYTLTVGVDNWEGGSFPDRGYVRSGAHTNAQKVGDLVPPNSPGSTRYWQSLVRSGQSNGILESSSSDTMMQTFVCAGYGFDTAGESMRMRPTGIASFSTAAESPWGYPIFQWYEGAGGGSWQFIQGQTYTIKTIRSA